MGGGGAGGGGGGGRGGGRRREARGELEEPNILTGQGYCFCECNVCVLCRPAVLPVLRLQGEREDPTRDRETHMAPDKRHPHFVVQHTCAYTYTHFKCNHVQNAFDEFQYHVSLKHVNCSLNTNIRAY